MGSLTPVILSSRSSLKFTEPYQSFMVTSSPFLLYVVREPACLAVAVVDDAHKVVRVVAVLRRMNHNSFLISRKNIYDNYLYTLCFFNAICMLPHMKPTAIIHLISCLLRQRINCGSWLTKWCLVFQFTICC